MRKILACLPVLFCLFLQAQTPASDPHWQLNTGVSDEFSYTGSQAAIRTKMRSRWFFLDGNGNVPPTVNAYSSDQGDNIFVNNGICSLMVDYAPAYYPFPCGGCPGNYPVFYDYTRGQLNSHASLKYGYYEVKFRLPHAHYPNQGATVRGIEANFWFFPINPSSPIPPYQELDVFEMVNGSQYIFFPTIHYGGNSNALTQNQRYPKIGMDLADEANAPFNYRIDFSDAQFHTVGFEWQPEYVAMYVDGKLERSMNFEQDKFSTMNVILDMNVKPFNVMPATLFPYYYEIDYFRYYNYNTASASPLSVCSSGYANSGSSNNLGYTVRSQVQLGGSGCSAKVQSGADLVLRATQSIVLDEGFECDSSSTLYLQVNNR